MNKHTSVSWGNQYKLIRSFVPPLHYLCSCLTSLCFKHEHSCFFILTRGVHNVPVRVLFKSVTLGGQQESLVINANLAFNDKGQSEGSACPL